MIGLGYLTIVAFLFFALRLKEEEEEEKINIIQ
jgi:hypothetical protein